MDFWLPAVRTAPVSSSMLLGAVSWLLFLAALPAPGCSLAAPGCSWLLLVAPGCSSVLPAAPGSSGCSWLLLAAPGCSWLFSWLAPGCFWMFLVVPGCSWLLLALLEHSWDPLLKYILSLFTQIRLSWDILGISSCSSSCRYLRRSGLLGTFLGFRIGWLLCSRPVAHRNAKSAIRCRRPSNIKNVTAPRIRQTGSQLGLRKGLLEFPSLWQGYF